MSKLRIASGARWSPPRARDVLLYNVILGTLVVGSLYWNPEMGVQDYPDDIKEKFGAPREGAKRQKAIFAIPFFLVTVGGVLWSTLRLKRRAGGSLTFSEAFSNIYGLVMSFWLFDLTVLDWLLLVTIRPSRVVLPGTEGMAGYDDYLFHLRVHLRAAPGLAVASAVLAAITIVLPVRADAGRDVP